MCLKIQAEATDSDKYVCLYWPNSYQCKTIDNSHSEDSDSYTYLAQTKQQHRRHRGLEEQQEVMQQRQHSGCVLGYVDVRVGQGDVAHVFGQSADAVDHSQRQQRAIQLPLHRLVLLTLLTG